MATWGNAAGTANITEGYMIKPESRILLGLGPLFESLETSSQAYQTYGIPIGVAPGAYVDLGLINALGFTFTVTVEPVEAANVPAGAVYDVTGEEMKVTATVYEFKPETIKAAINGGISYFVDEEAIFAFGGGCNIVNRPVVIEFVNEACGISPTTYNYAPSTTPGEHYFHGGILTMYDGICTSGLPWDTMSRGELNQLALEFTGRPVMEFARGNRLGSLYIY